MVEAAQHAPKLLSTSGGLIFEIREMMARTVAAHSDRRLAVCLWTRRVLSLGAICGRGRLGG